MDKDRGDVFAGLPIGTIGTVAFRLGACFGTPDRNLIGFVPGALDRSPDAFGIADARDDAAHLEVPASAPEHIVIADEPPDLFKVHRRPLPRFAVRKGPNIGPYRRLVKSGISSYPDTAERVFCYHNMTASTDGFAFFIPAGNVMPVF
jgi:hypothetical protein